MGLPEAPRPVSVGNCHLAVFLLGFAAAIWHFRGATTCFYWASKLPSSLSQQPFNALLSSTPSELCHGSRGPANCFCWPSHELLQHGPGACLCAFPLPLQSFKIRRPLPSFGLGGAAPGITVGVEHGPGACFVLFHCPFKASKASEAMPCHCSSRSPLETRTVSVGLRSCYLALLTSSFRRRFVETAIWHVFSTP